MIQELLRGGGGGGGSSAGVVLGGATERKFSINCGVFEGSVSSTTNTTTHFNTSSTTPQPPPPPQTTTTTTTTCSNPNPNFPTSAAVASDQQNLRCPRCDSSNTKFCYYNNYNLTQPRHFCKTCRRYWTKGGALRNVPIGGGCRKNKSSIVSTTAAVKSSTGKVKVGSPDIVKSALGFGFDHDHPPSSITNPILWPSPQNSHLLALLRATSQNPNPNPNPLKEDGNMIGSHHHMISSSDQHSTAVSGALNARSLSLDPMSSTSHVPMSLCSSFWRNNQNQNQNHQQQQQQQQHHQQQQQQQQQNHHQQQSFLVGHEVQNSGIQELYQRLRSSTNYYSDHSPVVPTANNVISTSAATSTSILEPSSVAGAAELGYWNPSFSWSNLSTTNGAFP